MNLSLACVRLENGRCLFLDGLEELPVTDQAKVLTWAKRLAAPNEIVRAKRMRVYYENCEPPPHIGIK